MSVSTTLPIYRCRHCLRKAEVVQQPVATQYRNGRTLTSGGKLLITCKTVGCTHSYLTVHEDDKAELAANYAQSDC